MVDSGTTTTRVRAWRDGGVVWSASRAAGARDTAVDGHNGAIRAALAELLSALENAAGAPAAVICSGMITSNMGLYELPHLVAPAAPDDTARGIVRADIPGLPRGPFAFVPGVRTPPGANLAGLASGDVLRGEEAEIVGLRRHLRLERPAVFLHIGSHHKAIDVTAAGAIAASRTAPTGELLDAVMNATILKSSTVPLDGFEPEAATVLAGAAAAREHGFGRALFLVRVGEQLAGLSRERATSYLLGVLASLDLDLLAGHSPDTPVIIYGTGAFPPLLARLLAAEGWQDVRVLPPEVADTAAAAGAVWLFERSLELEDRT